MPVVFMQFQKLDENYLKTKQPVLGIKLDNYGEAVPHFCCGSKV
jgi:hypothetical protein